MPTVNLNACIDYCTECHRVCMETLTWCLQQGGDHADRAHITLMLDCADICEAAARFMMRSSPLHLGACELCADVCTRCAEDCQRFDEDMMRACAEACTECADACREMSRARPQPQVRAAGR